jgi:hypothetical protein
VPLPPHYLPACSCHRRRCLSASVVAVCLPVPPPPLPTRPPTPPLPARLRCRHRCMPVYATTAAAPPAHAPAATWRSRRCPPLRGEGASRSKEEPLCTHLPSSRHPPASRHRCRLETSSAVTVRRQQPSSPYRTQQQDLASSLTCLKQCCKFI